MHIVETIDRKYGWNVNREPWPLYWLEISLPASKAPKWSKSTVRLCHIQMVHMRRVICTEL